LEDREGRKGKAEGGGIYSSNTYPSREKESWVFGATGEIEDP